MTKLIKLTENFKTSRPIFRLTKNHNGDRIEAALHNAARYRPTPEVGDPLSELVCENYRETFNADGGKFLVSEDIAQHTMRDIRNSMTIFLEKNLEMKSPTQSKLYRWYYRNLPNSVSFNDMLVMVYQYMRSFSNAQMFSHSIEHTNNTIALLGAIMEKYDEQK